MPVRIRVKNGFGTADRFENFHLTGENDKDAVIEIAKLCAESSAQGTVMHFDKFHFAIVSDLQAIIDIARICYNNDKATARALFRSFGFMDNMTDLLAALKMLGPREGNWPIILSRIDPAFITEIRVREFMDIIFAPTDEARTILAINEKSGIYWMARGGMVGKLTEYLFNPDSPQDLAKLPALTGVYKYDWKAFTEFMEKVVADDKGILRPAYDLFHEDPEKFLAKYTQNIATTPLVQMLGEMEDPDGMGAPIYPPESPNMAERDIDENHISEDADRMAKAIKKAEDLLFQYGRVEELVVHIALDGLHPFNDMPIVVEIAKLFARHDGGETARLFKSFNLIMPWHKDYVIDIAKTCAQQNAWETASNFSNFGLSVKNDKEAVIEIAKLCALQDSVSTAIGFRKFGLTVADDLAAVIDIARICYSRNSEKVKTFFEFFGFKDCNAAVFISALKTLGSAEGDWPVILSAIDTFYSYRAIDINDSELMDLIFAPTNQERTARAINIKQRIYREYIARMGEASFEDLLSAIVYDAPRDKKKAILIGIGRRFWHLFSGKREEIKLAEYTINPDDPDDLKKLPALTGVYKYDWTTFTEFMEKTVIYDKGISRSAYDLFHEDPEKFLAEHTTNIATTPLVQMLGEMEDPDGMGAPIYPPESANMTAGDIARAQAELETHEKTLMTTGLGSYAYQNVANAIATIAEKAPALIRPATLTALENVLMTTGLEPGAYNSAAKATATIASINAELFKDAYSGIQRLIQSGYADNAELIADRFQDATPASLFTSLEGENWPIVLTTIDSSFNTTITKDDLKVLFLGTSFGKTTRAITIKQRIYREWIRKEKGVDLKEYPVDEKDLPGLTGVYKYDWKTFTEFMEKTFADTDGTEKLYYEEFHKNPAEFLKRHIPNLATTPLAMLVEGGGLEGFEDASALSAYPPQSPNMTAGEIDSTRAKLEKHEKTLMTTGLNWDVYYGAACDIATIARNSIDQQLKSYCITLLENVLMTTGLDSDAYWRTAYAIETIALNVPTLIRPATLAALEKVFMTPHWDAYWYAADAIGAIAQKAPTLIRPATLAALEKVFMTLHWDAYWYAANAIDTIAQNTPTLICPTTLAALEKVLMATDLDSDAYWSATNAINTIAQKAPTLIRLTTLTALEKVLTTTGLDSDAYEAAASAIATIAFINAELFKDAYSGIQHLIQLSLIHI